MITERRLLLALILLSIALRVAVALYLGDTVPVGKDENSYSLLAARLATGYGYSFAEPWYPFGTPGGSPTSHWSFLYTAFVAGVYAIFGPHPLAARLVQAVVAGALMPVLTWRLARRLMVESARLKVEGFADMENPQPSTFQPSTTPLLAAFLSAIYAYFALYGAMVQTEAFFICALLWSLERALAVAEMLRRGAAQHDTAGGPVILSDRRGRRISPLPNSPTVQSTTFQPSTFNPQSSIFNLQSSISLGLSLGVATLLRQSILPWVAVMFAWLLWTGLRVESSRLKVVPASAGPRLTQVLASLALAGVVMLLCIAPFTIRNYVVYDNFLLLNSNAGYAMYSAQHPAHGTSFQEYWAAPLPEELAGRGLNEAEWDDALMARGVGFVLAEPGRYLMLSLSRVRDFVEFWPTADSSTIFNLGRVLSIGVFLPFMVYGMWLAVAHGRRKKEEGRSNLQPSTFNQSSTSNQSSIFLLAFMAFYSLLHIATWAMSRYRLPVDAVALIFAAGAFAQIGARVAGRRAKLAERA